MSFLPADALPLAAVFLLAGTVKGLLGLGLPTVAMGLLGLFMRPAEAAALLILPSLVTNVWQLLARPRLGPLARRFWPMMLAIAAGTLASAGLIAGTPTPAAGAALGAALGATLVLYALTGLARLRLRVPTAAERWAGPLAGAMTGLVTGATGVFVVPAVPYLGALDLDRDDLVQALGLSFTVSTLALAAGLALHGALPLAASARSLLAVLPALAGMALGGWLRTRIQPAPFRLCFFASLLALGTELLWRGLR
ncbi:MAG: sulfite exporter TauE/SafE family protein [Janthinobacterium lividum]